MTRSFQFATTSLAILVTCPLWSTPAHGVHISNEPAIAYAETLQDAGVAVSKMSDGKSESLIFGRETRKIAGWKVHISRELLAQESKATARALELLQKQLEEIVRVAPPPAVAELQKVPLYFSPEYPGVKPRAEFHPGAGWLRDHGRDPAMAKGVEFTNIRIFEREMNRMPNFALHELAHAYHDRVLPQGFGNPEIKAAYERAKAGGKYDRVERWHGNGQPNTFEQAYAMTNPQEFFAENTEAFFSRNDYFPFTRDELKRHDPDTFALLGKLWNLRPEEQGPTKSDGIGKAPYEPTWESVNRHNPGGTAPEWFRDAKFGIYFHWGAYSVPAFRASAFGEWYPKSMNTTGSGENIHHLNTYGDPSTWPYENFLLGANDKNGNRVQFAPRLKSAGGQLDPGEYAQLFVDAGAKFAGPVFEHHDGVSMWHSEVNEWNVYDKGPQLDTAKLFIDAFRRKGLKIVAPFHHAFNLAGWYPTNNPNYGPAKSISTRNASLQKLYGKLPADQEYQLWLDKLKEVIDNYQPDLMWHDVMVSALPKQYRLEYLSYYYNQALAWNKEVLVTYKNTDLNRECAVLDFEGGGNSDVSLYTWLSDSPVGHGSWSYVEGMKYYSGKSMLHTFIDRVSKNGQLLLNISPKADGSIPQAQKDILLTMGDWLKKFGESIYSTRAWTVAGEGPTVVDGPKEFVSRDIRFTRSKANNILYAIVGGWPGNGAQLNITSLNSNRINLGTLARVELFGETPGIYIDLGFAQDDQGLKVNMPSSLPYKALAYPLKLTFSGQIPAITFATAPPIFFEHDNFGGYGVTLGEGAYTTAQLVAAGIKDNDVSSVRVNNGWTVEMYDGDNFTGPKLTVVWDVISLQVDHGFGDKMSSVKIYKTGSSAPTTTKASKPTAKAENKFVIAAGPYKPTWESLKQYQYPDWFSDAKFGIWAHWGVQCQPEMGDWYAWHIYRPAPGSSIYKFHCENYGHPSVFGLKDLCNAWKAEKWDPDQLMRLYKKAGAQYFVAMGNHHDNFDNWDSKYQPWNTVNVGPQKDLLGIWAKAARQHGLRFGVSIHSARAWDWLEAAHGGDPDGPKKGVPYDGALTKADGKGKWWDGLDPADLYCPHGIQRTPEARRAYQFKFFQRVTDLLDKYQPDLLYFDDIDLPCGEAGMNIAAHFYNANLQWNKGRQEAILNTKRAPSGCRKTILLDIERGQRDTLDPQPWQTDTCIGDWHYKKNAGYQQADSIIPMLVDIVSKNGNLLLNVPLKGDGTPDAEEVKILEQLGAWMAINSVCIYGTRPWTTYGEGPALKLGTVSKETRYFSGQTAANIRFTKKGDTLYAILFAWPGDGKSVIRSLAKTNGSDKNKLSSVSLLGYPDKLAWTQTGDGLVVSMPAKKPCDYAYVLKIEGVGLEAIPSKDDISIAAAADGRIVLAAESASLFGYSPAFRIRRGDKVISIGGWTDWDDYVTWDVRVGQPGSYAVEIEYGCPNQCAGSEYTINMEDQALKYAVGPTGDWEKFKKEKAGVLNLTNAGVQTLTIRPTKGKWHNAMNVRSVTLSPL